MTPDQPSPSSLSGPQFEALFKAHFEGLCRYALPYVQDLDTAKEIVQKVFVSLWERREKMDLNQPIKAYLYRAVRSRCLNHIRDHQKFRSRVLDLEVLATDLEEEPGAEDQEQLKQDIEQAMSELPEKCRKVFEMSRFQGMKYKEIAEELEVSVKTVEAHISRAMRILRERLSGKGLLFWWILSTLGFSQYFYFIFHIGFWSF